MFRNFCINNFSFRERERERERERNSRVVHTGTLVLQQILLLNHTSLYVKQSDLV